jgi:hypothetical protein
MKTTVAKIKEQRGGIFTFNGFLYQMTFDGTVYETAALGDNKWNYYLVPKDHEVDAECVVEQIEIRTTFECARIHYEYIKHNGTFL